VANETTTPSFGACPTPVRRYEEIVLGHGSGGRLTHELVQRLFVPGFASPVLAALEDQATLPIDQASRIAFTTDAFVVRPLFFPGGDIGRLAIHGTVNDLAVGGAEPRWLSASFILEEGLPLTVLERVVASMRRACHEAEVQLVTGDTKVVDRGKGDQIFITTAGIGIVGEGRRLSIANARPGDRLIVSGTMGDHGSAILACREGLELETALESDSAPLTGLVRRIFAGAPRSEDIRCMRDPTRGGLASVLNELAEGSSVGVEIEERAVPVRAEVRGICELLGLDPLYVANEGKLVAVVAPEAAEPVLAAMRAHPLGQAAAVIGTVVAEHAGLVTTRWGVGSERLVPMLEGEQLPRIC
jgi:hydrogenase expression/formation protein HypE